MGYDRTAFQLIHSFSSQVLVSWCRTVIKSSSICWKTGSHVFNSFFSTATGLNYFGGIHHQLCLSPCISKQTDNWIPTKKWQNMFLFRHDRKKVWYTVYESKWLLWFANVPDIILVGWHWIFILNSLNSSKSALETGTQELMTWNVIGLKCASQIAESKIAYEISSGNFDIFWLSTVHLCLSYSAVWSVDLSQYLIRFNHSFVITFWMIGCLAPLTNSKDNVMNIWY